MEWIKPGFEQPIDAGTYKQTVEFFTELMHLLHPFMPFVTEEIYHLLAERNDDLMVKEYSKVIPADRKILAEGNLLKNIISGLRDVRNKHQIKPKETISLHIQTKEKNVYELIENILSKQLNTASVFYVNEPVAGTITTVIGKDKFYIETSQPLDTAEQREGLEKELAHLQGFLATTEKKLGNEKFVQNAKPEVLELERKKKNDAETKIKVIQESLAGLN